jgi:hypothetical protein
MAHLVFMRKGTNIFRDILDYDRYQLRCDYYWSTGIPSASSCQIACLLVIGHDSDPTTSFKHGFPSVIVAVAGLYRQTAQAC